MAETPKCSSYEERFIPDYGHSINTGELLYRKECRCLDTKEREICSCGGDENICDFYPEKRELKPCPFCGGTPAVYKQRRLNENEFSVVCGKCCAQTPGFTEAYARRAWNRRV